ncbi:uncharacterized protein LOC132980246 isoform X1 [Labrus mixtus]|uniref:uncharacterized protein LOC132980246 isoform X1 n=1 Tax=Labrus mixtus TaxID=508554 RepID=UPI0029BFEFE6|nr:uncharacterized protein LOC132980246 isoform X1 [Labrus mixtus]
MMEERPKSDHERGFSTFLLRGELNEEESARSFQEALRQWRGEKRDVAGETMSEEAMWTPVRPVSVSAMGTQTDLASDRGAKGRGKGEGEDRVPFRVEFTENSLTYMDRLLLKKHRRTPIEAHSPSLAFESDLKSQHNPDTEEETASSLTAEEEDFRRYFASLFAVPHSRGRTDPQTTTPESCLIIEVLDERDTDIGGVFIPQQRKDNNGKCSPGQQVLSNGRATVPQTPLTNASSSESKSSACSTAETPRALKKSIKTPTIMSHKPYCSPTVHKSKPDCGSPQLVSSLSLQDQTRIPMSSHSPTSFQPDVSPLASATPTIPEEPHSPSPSIYFSLRSTFTVSPSSSTESPLLPTVNQSTPPQIGSDSSLLPVQPQSSQLFSQSVSSMRLSQSSPSNLLSQRQSQQSLCDPEFLLSHHQLQLPQSPVSPSPNPPPRTLEPCQAVRSPPGAYSRHASTPTNQDTPIVMSFTSISGDHESTASQQDTQCIPSLLSHNFDVPQDSFLALKVEEEEEEELSIDSGDDMSSDSLGLAPHEDDSSDEDTQMHGRLMREETREEERGYLAISYPDDSLVAAEREKELQTDEQEQLSEPAMVMQRRSVGSGSEQFCDLDGFLPLGLDINSGHSDTADHTHRDSLHTSRTSLNESELAESEDFGPSSSLTSRTEEHLAIRLMKGNHTQPTEIKIRSTTPTRRGEISATELGTSVLGSVLSQAAKEILEICCVDKAGCEDPDLDNDTTENTLHDLEQELRLMTKGKQNSILGSEKHGSQGQHGEHRLTPGRVREEQKDEEAAAQRDRQSVLSLP